VTDGLPSKRTQENTDIREFVHLATESNFLEAQQAPINPDCLTAVTMTVAWESINGNRKGMKISIGIADWSGFGAWLWCSSNGIIAAPCDNRRSETWNAINGFRHFHLSADDMANRGLFICFN
jgi:hypothetical protein